MVQDIYEVATFAPGTKRTACSIARSALSEEQTLPGWGQSNLQKQSMEATEIAKDFYYL